MTQSAASNLDSDSFSQEEAKEALDLLLRLQAPTDVFKFGEYVFGYEPAAHHREMVDFFQSAIATKTNSVALYPRGAAKSTWITLILGTYLIATRPNIRIGLFSKTAERAFDLSRGMRLTLERNERFREVFGHLVSDTKWTDATWLRAGSRWEGSQYLTLFAGGVGGQVVSKRFDVVILDDVVDDENTATTEQRERINQWMWKTLYPCLSSDGIVLVVGTRWSEDDLYQTLTDPKPKGRGWNNIVRGALVERDGGLFSYWPQVWPISTLLEMKDNMGGPLFACAYLNDITGLLEGNIFRSEWFQYFDQLPEGEYTYRMGVDLAMSTRERADYTARVLVAENRTGDFFVLSAYRDKMESGHAQFVDNGYRAAAEAGHRPSLVKVESVQGQSLLVQELMRDYPHIPVSPKKTDTDKTTRGRAVAARYEAHKVYHHVSLRGSEDFERELLSFPRGHDDFVDSLGFAMDLGGNDFSFSVLKSSDLKIARGAQPVDQDKIAAAVKTQESDLLKREMRNILSAHFGRLQ